MPDLDLPQYVLASGAVGTAAMGIVEGCKATWLPPMGFRHLKRRINWADSALQNAYGTEYETLIQSLYRNGRSAGQLPRILRQGVRIGLDGNNAKAMEETLLAGTPERLSKVAKKVSEGEPLNDNEKNILGRFEVAADARIDAALSLAERAYNNGMRLAAFIVAIALSLTAAYAMTGDFKHFDAALIVGLVGVPLAPIAKDVAKGLQAATKAIGGRQ